MVDRRLRRQSPHGERKSAITYDVVKVKNVRMTDHSSPMVLSVLPLLLLVLLLGLVMPSVGAVDAAMSPAERQSADGRPVASIDDERFATPTNENFAEMVNSFDHVLVLFGEHA